MGQAGFQMTAKVAAQTIGKAIDVELNANADEVDITTRSSGGWREFIQGLKDWTAQVDQLWVPSDAALQALRSAYLAGTVIAVKFLDKDGNGFSGNAIVTAMNRGEPLADACKLPITLRGTGALTVLNNAS